MREHGRRWRKVKAQIDAMFPEPELTAEEDTAAQADRDVLIERWLMRLAESMAEEHGYLLRAWVMDFRQPCLHAPCPIPRGLEHHIFILWGWILDASKPVALPAAVVEAYLRYPDLPNRAWPWIECECSYPIPIVGFFNIEHTPPKPQVELFSRCPICASPYIGWKAHSILTKAPGFATLIPYSQR